MEVVVPLSKPALLLLGHGSKIEEANNELLRLGACLKEESGIKIVEVAFLQLAEPLFYAGIKNCIRKGARKIIIVPYFLYKGAHVKQDIPRQIEDMKKDMPEVDIILAGHIGFHQKLVEIILDRITEYFKE